MVSIIHSFKLYVYGARHGTHREMTSKQDLHIRQTADTGKKFPKNVTS